MLLAVRYSLLDGHGGGGENKENNLSERLLAIDLLLNMIRIPINLTLKEMKPGAISNNFFNKFGKITNSLGIAAQAGAILSDGARIVQDPQSWDNYGSLGITGLSVSLYYVSGPGTFLGFGVTYLDFAGAFDSYYNDMDWIGYLNTSKVNRVYILGLYFQNYPIKKYKKPEWKWPYERYLLLFIL